MTNESEKNPARRVDDKHPGVSVDWSDAPRFNALGIAETWSVTVEAEGKRLLSIGDQYVAGLDTDELEPFIATIRSCAMHLLGFIGAGPIAACAEPAYRAPAAATVLTDEREVGCERTDGLLNIHAESATCEVCAPAAAGIEGLTRYTDEEIASAPFSNRSFYLAADVKRLLAHAGVTAEPVDLHNAIMNLPADVPKSCGSHDLMLAYKIGHRDARHAAAELALSAIVAQVPAAEVRAAALDEHARFTIKQAADALAYVAYNYDGSKLEDLKPGVVESTGASESALIAERNLRELLSTADKASEVRAAEWISVNDRLPKIGEEVLIWCGYRICGYRSDDKHDPENHNGWVIDFDNGRASAITHWMPLPAAPSTADSAGTGARGEGAEA